MRKKIPDTKRCQEFLISEVFPGYPGLPREHIQPPHCSDRTPSSVTRADMVRQCQGLLGAGGAGLDDGGATRGAAGG